MFRFCTLYADNLINIVNVLLESLYFARHSPCWHAAYRLNSIHNVDNTALKYLFSSLYALHFYVASNSYIYFAFSEGKDILGRNYCALPVLYVLDMVMRQDLLQSVRYIKMKKGILYLHE